MNRFAVTACTIVIAAAALHATPARASHWSNAVDTCQGSLPSFEGALRKRPLAIVNEGTSNAFVVAR